MFWYVALSPNINQVAYLKAYTTNHRIFVRLNINLILYSPYAACNRWECLPWLTSWIFSSLLKIWSLSICSTWNGLNVIAFIPKNLKISNRGETKWIPFNSRWQLNTTDKDQFFWNTEKQKSQNTHYGPAVQLVILPKWSP